MYNIPQRGEKNLNIDLDDTDSLHCKKKTAATRSFSKSYLCLVSEISKRNDLVTIRRITVCEARNHRRKIFYFEHKKLLQTRNDFSVFYKTPLRRLELKSPE